MMKNFSTQLCNKNRLTIAIFVSGRTPLEQLGVVLTPKACV